MCAKGESVQKNYGMIKILCSRIGTHARRKQAKANLTTWRELFFAAFTSAYAGCSQPVGMPREPDPATDGAFSLLSLSNQRDNNDKTAAATAISNLSSPVVTTPQLPPPPPAPAQTQDALELLQLPSTTSALAHTASPMLAQQQITPLDSATPRALLYDPGGTNTLAKQVRTENHGNSSNVDCSRLKNPVPRLPSLSGAEGRTHNDALIGTISEPNVSRSPHAHIPRLARISEWAPSGSSISNSASPLIRLNPISLPRMPSALPPLTSQTASDYRQPSWVRSSMPSMQIPFHSTAAPPIVHDFRSHTAPPVFPIPNPQSQVQPGMDYYFQPSAQPQYMSVSLPQIRPPQPPPPRLAVPSYSMSNFRSTLSPPSLGQTSLSPPNASVGNALPPIVNPLGKSIAHDSITNSCGDTVRNPLPPLASSGGKVSPPVNDAPASKSMFKGPASSGRGFVNLMNPADTLASLAQASERPPVEHKKIESPPVSQKSRTPNMKMALELFGTGNDLSLEGEKERAKIRNQDLRSPSDKLLAPLVNGKSRDRSTESDEINLNTLASSQNSPKNDLRKRGKDSPQPSKLEPRKFPKKIYRVIESEEDDSSDTEGDDDIDDSSEVTRCACGLQADSGTMIACDQCNTWQHRICMGYRRKSEVPKRYYCHICRPDDIRTNCVAHPRFKERMAMKDEEDRCEPILLSVKPLELRRQFMADMRAKRDGKQNPLDTDIFKRYAKLYRTHFGKDRQSVIEGLVVLTELPRNDVMDKFEEASKRTKKESFENLNIIPNGDQYDRKRLVSGSQSPAISPNENGAQAQQRSGQKRGRSGVGTNEYATESSDVEQRLHLDMSSDKEMSVGERNRLSREERKNLQVMSLFKRLDDRERDKKRPRYGEPSSSPRSSALASPRSMGDSPARPGTSVPGSLKLASSLVNRSSDSLSSEGRKVISIDVSQYESGDHITIPKLDIHLTEKKEQRRKELRDVSADRKVQGGILSSRRQRQTLSSVGIRKRGKSNNRINVGDIDPSLRFNVKIPGPSVIGSRLVPPSRRSRLSNEEIDETVRAMKISKASRFSKKHRIKSSQKAVEIVSASGKRPPVPPVRKRLRHLRKTDDTVKDSSELKVKSSDDVVLSADCDPLITKSGTCVSPAPGHDHVARDSSLKKRMLIRCGEVSSGAKYGRARPTESSCFKKRLLSSGPSKVVAKPQLVSKSKIISKPKINPKSNEKSVPVSRLTMENSSVEQTPAAEKKVKTQKMNDEYSEQMLRVSAIAKTEAKNAAAISAPVESEKRSESKLSAKGAMKSLAVSSVISKAVPAAAPSSLSLALRAEKMNLPKISIPSRSLSSSPVPSSFRTPPPQIRSTGVNRETKSGPGKLGGNGSSATPPCAPFRISSSPPPRTPRPLPASARAPFPLRSKPVAPSKSNGNSATVKIDGDESGLTTASDILQSRLQGFLSQSKKPSTSQNVVDTPAPSPRIPKSVGRHSRIPCTPSPSPRVGGGLGMKPKYGSGGPAGPWRSFDGPKRVLASGAASVSIGGGGGGGGGRIGEKTKSEGRMRGNGTRMSKAGGSLNAGTSAWSQYRRQNGWAPVTGGKHIPYTAPGGASSSHDGKSNGRRRPYG